MTDPHSAPAPGGHSGSDDVVTHLQSGVRDIAGVGDGPPADAMTRLDALHRQLQAALADLDQA